MKKIAFSTLACPEWTLPEIVRMASKAGYQGIELRFVQGEDALWKLPVFCGAELAATKRTIRDSGLEIVCVDTSCRFHWPKPQDRQRAVEEGERMADLAASLGAPGIRVFGDTIQSGADRINTRRWIAESVRALAEKTIPKGVGVWLETHGDFASSAETLAILRDAGWSLESKALGTIWDPANCFVDSDERPSDGGHVLGPVIRNVHLKDMRRNETGKWEYVLMGEGTFPCSEVLTTLHNLRYDKFVTFEWEKKWHPKIPNPEVALPHFAEWYRRTYKDAG
jgi:sugar phosphate isomerase/epimerase